MKIKVRLTFKETYYPANDRREEGLFHYVTEDAGSFDLKEAEEADFPVACVVTNQRGRKTEYRFMDGKLWKKSLRSVDSYKKTVEDWGSVPSDEKKRAEDRFEECMASAIILGSTRALALADIGDDVTRHAVFGGGLWETCPEPRLAFSFSENVLTLRVIDEDPKDGVPGYNLNDAGLARKRAEAFGKRDGCRAVIEDEVGVKIPSAFRFGSDAGDFASRVSEAVNNEWAAIFGSTGKYALSIVQNRVLPVLKESLEASFRPIYLCEGDDIKFAILSVVEEALEESDRLRNFDVSSVEKVFDEAKEKALSLISAARDPAKRELVLPDAEKLVPSVPKREAPEPPKPAGHAPISMPPAPEARNVEVPPFPSIASES